MTESVASVLAEMRTAMTGTSVVPCRQLSSLTDRLAAAHEWALLGLRADLVITKAHRNEQRDRAEAAEALLRKVGHYTEKWQLDILSPVEALTVIKKIMEEQHA